MRRYPQGVDPDLLPVQNQVGMLLLTAVLGLVAAVALIWMGVRGRQLWMWVWGIGLMCASLAMAVTLIYQSLHGQI